MDKDTRNAIERATQRARKLLEEDFAAQLEGDFDVRKDGEVAAKAGKHLSARQAFSRERIVAAIEHKRAAGMSAADAVRDYLRDAAFTALNRFVALKMLEARELVQECITKGEQSGGFREFCGMAPGLPLLSDSAGYRLYIESLFDELSTEVKVLFDRRDASSVLWPKRATFEQLLEILNATELARVWGEDETIGWVYQFFNGQDERKKMREESQAPRNSRELAVRNQFFTPRYVVQFLTDNTLGRIWFEMQQGHTRLAGDCAYLIREASPIFLSRVGLEAFPSVQPGIREACEGRFDDLPEKASWNDMQCLALAIDGYRLAPMLGLGDCGDFANAQCEAARTTGEWKGSAVELWICLFFEQRRARGEIPRDDELALLERLYAALREALQHPASVAGRPHFIGARERKDPRLLRVLDPACGSGHFLLYAFDLLLAIYQEAWFDAELGPALWQAAGVAAPPLGEAAWDAELVEPSSVRLKPDAQAHCFRCAWTGAPSDARLVLVEYGTLWLAGRPLVYCRRCSGELKPALDLPLTGFHIERALQRGWFAHSTASQFVGLAEVFEYRRGATHADSFETRNTLAQPERFAPFIRQLPAWILAHNLHGVDIDARCAQIAQLALWMRAQRAYRDFDVARSDRPQIRRANIVVAEPVAAEPALVADFGSKLGDSMLRELFERMVAALQRAGDLGLLLRVEQLGEDFTRPQIGLFESAEARLHETLARFVRESGNAQRTQRRLFADDAEQGLGLLELASAKYDVVLMNPPFGAGSARAKKEFEKAYPRTKNDVYAAFVERGIELLHPRGRLGAITSRTGFFLSSFQKWREDILLREAPPAVFADLGYGVLDSAMVEVAAYCLEKQPAATSN